MPWKNGRGNTREVASEIAPNDPAGRFLWRISLATVEGKNDFSAFPGIDRTIAVLSGNGMRLTIDGVAQSEITTPSEPFPFSGDSTVFAECIDGRVIDLNAMTLRGQARHRMERFVVEEPTVLQSGHDRMALVFAGACRADSEGRIFEAAAEDVLTAIAKGERIALSAYKPCTVYTIGIDFQD